MKSCKYQNKIQDRGFYNSGKVKAFVSKTLLKEEPIKFDRHDNLKIKHFYDETKLHKSKKITINLHSKNAK
jgi:hypothetical protein